MSELKVYRCNEWHNEYTEFYLKSEADKVIEEKETKLQDVSELLKETREWLIEAQKLHKRCADNAIKMLRHHKYRRCLAMVKWCRFWANYWRCCKPTDCGMFIARAKFFRKWQKRWEKLAEKFKETK